MPKYTIIRPSAMYIPTGLVANRWFSLVDLKRPDYPEVARYYDLLAERPAYRRHGRNGLP